MISKGSHVAPTHVPDTWTTGLVSTAKPTLKAIVRSTVFPLATDLKTPTDTPDIQHTDAPTQTNISNAQDEPSIHTPQNIKGESSRTNPSNPHTSCSVVFKNNNGVTPNSDMNTYRKLRMKRRIILLTVMTIGFFTTMVYSLLFSCCSVISVDRETLPTRWEPGVGLILSDTPDPLSASDTSLPELDRSSSTLQSNNYDVRGSVAHKVRIPSPEILVVSSQSAGHTSVLDREYPRKKSGSRTILLVPSSDTLPFQRSSLTHTPEFLRTVIFKSSPHRSEEQIKQQKKLTKRESSNLGHVHHRNRHFIKMQQKILSKQQLKVKSKHEFRILESLKSHPDQRSSTTFYPGHRNINDMEISENDLIPGNFQEKQHDIGTKMGNIFVGGNANNTTKNVTFPVISEDFYSKELPEIRFHSPKENVHSELATIQIETKDANDNSNNFIDFKNILSKSKTEKSSISGTKITSDSRSNFGVIQPIIEQRIYPKTSILFNKMKKENFGHWKRSTLAAETNDLKQNISPQMDFSAYYLTGTRDTGTMDNIGTSRRANNEIDFDMDANVRDSSKMNEIRTPLQADSQIDIKALDTNLLASDKTSIEEVDGRKSVMHTGGKEDYDYYNYDFLPGGTQKIFKSEAKYESPMLKDSTEKQSGVFEDSKVTEKLFVNSRQKARSINSYFEYRDYDDDNGGGVNGLGYAAVVNNKSGYSSKPRRRTTRSRAPLPRSLAVSPISSSFSRVPSFLSEWNKHSPSAQKQDSLSSLLSSSSSSLSSSSAMAFRPISTSSAPQRRAKSKTKRPSILSRLLQQHSHQPWSDLQQTLKNQSASLPSSSLSSSFLLSSPSTSSPSESIASVRASVAPLTADKSHVNTTFVGEGYSRHVLFDHGHNNGPSGGRVQHFATKKLPQAIIIGVKKGGTRAVLEFLRLHPSVRAPGPEPHFFDRHYQKGFDWYRNKMPATFDDQLTIEKTPSYFVTKEVPQRIFNMSRDIKLIVVVRDPVTRAISDYTQTVSKRPQVRSFEQMVFINNTRIVDTSWGAIRIGVYAKHVSLWLKFFNLSQIHFVNGERLITDPAGEMAQLQDFLGLKRFINERHFYFNETKGFPCLKKSEGSGHPHCLGKTKGRTHPIISQKVLKRLRDFYRPFNTKFYHLVKKDFRWS